MRTHFGFLAPAILLSLSVVAVARADRAADASLGEQVARIEALSDAELSASLLDAADAIERAIPEAQAHGADTSAIDDLPEALRAAAQMPGLRDELLATLQDQVVQSSPELATAVKDGGDLTPKHRSFFGKLGHRLGWLGKRSALAVLAVTDAMLVPALYTFNLVIGTVHGDNPTAPGFKLLLGTLGGSLGGELVLLSLAGGPIFYLTGGIGAAVFATTFVICYQRPQLHYCEQQADLFEKIVLKGSLTGRKQGNWLHRKLGQAKGWPF